MKYALTGLLLFIISTGCHAEADNKCSNPNPYIQQTCENLKQSSAKVQEARDEKEKKKAAEQKEALNKLREEENKPPAPPPPKIPDWQKALKPPVPAQNENPDNTKTDGNKGADAPPAITPLAPLEPTEFASPEAVVLPGGINRIPSKPDKNSSKGAIKYY